MCSSWIHVSKVLQSCTVGNRKHSHPPQEVVHGSAVVVALVGETADVLTARATSAGMKNRATKPDNI